MPKVNLHPLVVSASGKLCEHSNVAFATRNKSGKVYTVTRHPKNVKTEPTPEQAAQMAAFGSAGKIAGAWVRANTTYDAKGNPTERTAEYIAMKRLYDGQDKIKGFMAFLAKRIDPESGQIALATEA